MGRIIKITRYLLITHYKGWKRERINLHIFFIIFIVPSTSRRAIWDYMIFSYISSKLFCNFFFWVFVMFPKQNDKKNLKYLFKKARTKKYQIIKIIIIKTKKLKHKKWVGDKSDILKWPIFALFCEYTIRYFSKPFSPATIFFLVHEIALKKIKEKKKK